MFDLFNNKKVKKITMEKEQLEQEREQMLAVINRLNIANKEQSNLISELKIELNEAISKVRELAEQLRMKDAQKQASDRFNDDDRNY
jgi:hypothetical protein